MSVEIRSTMPGRIVQVSKKAGDKVLEGEEVLVMEAMKMEMPIFSPADGVIAAIKVGEGQAVAKDEILVLVE
jgi:acetyl-CoA carboxylase biotin carboxyl carrier protein